MEKLPNSMPTSIDIKQFAYANFTNDERIEIISIFNKIDNSEINGEKIDKDEKQGVISGQQAVQMFWTNLKIQFGDKFNELSSKIKESFDKYWLEEAQNALTKQQDEEIKLLKKEEIKIEAEKSRLELMLQMKKNKNPIYKLIDNGMYANESENAASFLLSVGGHAGKNDGEFLNKDQMLEFFEYLVLTTEINGESIKADGKKPNAEELYDRFLNGELPMLELNSDPQSGKIRVDKDLLLEMGIKFANMIHKEEE